MKGKTTVSLDTELVAKAKELRLNVSGILDRALRQDIERYAGKQNEPCPFCKSETATWRYNKNMPNNPLLACDACGARGSRDAPKKGGKHD